MIFSEPDKPEAIDALRSELYQTLTAPIDTMWENLYVASAQAYLIQEDVETLGYACIDDGHSLVQLYLRDPYRHQMEEVVQTLTETKLITSAKLSAMEPASFHTCLMLAQSAQANTFCFHFSERRPEETPALDLILANEENIAALKAFMKEQLGFEDTFGYTEDLVQRAAIYMLKAEGEIIATSECRLSATQPDYADLGVIVHKDQRGKGLATKILQQQALMLTAKGRKPICSTTVDNIASKKAIERAGFYCAHIIFDLTF